MAALRTFITDKYSNQQYAMNAWDKPPTSDNYVTHPFMEQVDAATPAGIAFLVAADCSDDPVWTSP